MALPRQLCQINLQKSMIEKVISPAHNNMLQEISLQFFHRYACKTLKPNRFVLLTLPIVKCHISLQKSI
jgi:hypothetical protein